ncbi:MAG: AAA family ATPase [Candidatus Aenigmarchaeota archaeon]|nr:AAA family ATPase [Candidatus Aenigmarchaeota archaeon]
MLFKNEEVLSPEYLPEILPHREGQIKELVRNIEVLAKGRKAENVFIYGPPGIGKTACVKFVFRQFKEYAGVHSVYINTWDYNTTSSLLAKIVLSLNYPIPRRGLSKDEILEKLIEVLKKLRKGLIVCLDEVDRLIVRDQNVLYDLVRINQYVDLPVCVIMISNFRDVLAKLEPRIASSLGLKEIEFKPYTLNEMKDILGERCLLAFKEPVEEGVVLLCANHAINRGGDVRVGLECLRKASRVAEEQGSERLKVEHVKAILKDVRAVKMEIVKENLKGVEKNIVEILNDGKTYTSTQLWEEYKRRFGEISQTALSEYVKRLKEFGLVKTREDRRESRGRKIYIRLLKRKRFK